MDYTKKPFNLTESDLTWVEQLFKFFSRIAAFSSSKAVESVFFFAIGSPPENNVPHFIRAPDRAAISLQSV